MDEIFACGSRKRDACGPRGLAVSDEAAEFDFFAFGGCSDEEGGAAFGEGWKLEIYFGDAVGVGAGVEDHRAETGAENFDHHLGVSDHFPLRSPADHKDH